MGSFCPHSVSISKMESGLKLTERQQQTRVYEPQLSKLVTMSYRIKSMGEKGEQPGFSGLFVYNQIINC